MPPNDEDNESGTLDATVPEGLDDSDPIGAMLERTRGDELDFEGVFEEQRLMQALFNTPPRAQSIGRFEIRERLGSGGMGEVYRAWDTKLDRFVALKLLRTSVQHSPVANILDEARALAKVEHDNVVRVYDADVHDDRPYLTMEVIEGQTLATWLTKRHSLSATISLFVRAGLGLQAIHDVGLVHGDFKPRNVLVGKDGRVRVADFGLAAAIGPEPSDDTALAELHRPAGTLAYLAPEQFLGAPPSPASDQFSFCVALFEAVCGVLPFPRRDADELRDSIERCEPQFPTTTDRTLPRWLRQLLTRGLHRDPAQRYGDMAALLEELGRDRRSRSRRALDIAVSISLVGALGFFVWKRPDDEPPPVQDPLADVWDEQQRERIDAAFASSDASWAAGSHDTFVADLDRWAQRWRPRWTHASEPRRSCLSDQRRQALIMVERLGEAKPELLRRAPELSAQLADPSRCLDPRPLSLPSTPESDRLRGQLATVIVERVGGDLDAAAAAIEQVIDGAREHGDKALEIDALRERALVRVNQGRRQAALDDLRSALTLATAAEDWRRLALIYVELTWTADDMTAPELRREWLDRAQAHVDRLGTDRDAQLAAARVRLGATLELALKQPAAAEAGLRELIAQLEPLDAERSLLAVHAQHALANALARQADRYAEANAAFERALELAAAVWGAGHPELAKLWSDYGIHAMVHDQPGPARERLRESLRLREAALSTPHPLLARSHIQLAQLELAEQRLPEARRHAQLAAANLTDELDQDRSAEIWRVLGQIAFLEDDMPAAIEAYRRSLAAAPKGATLQLAIAEAELASALVMTGQCEQATIHFDHSLEAVEAELVQVNPSQLIDTWSRRILALIECGDLDRARTEALRVRAYLADPDQRAQIEIPEP